MSNPFYNYSGSFIPGTLARAEAVASEFSNVQAGFADLATSGVDTGTSSAYVITTQGAPTTILADGDMISFKAANTNSGAATLNANSTGAVSVLRFNGTPLQAGDLSAGSWYTLTYNSTYLAWTLPGASVITFSGSISAAEPTHKVGLAAAAGSSTAAAPIDVTFAIDQTIAPTWSGKHTWTAANNTYGIAVNGGATTGQSFGVVINAGSNGSDMALDINSNTGANLVTVYGDGGLVVGNPTGSDKGAGTINASGAVYVNNSAAAVVGTNNAFTGTNTFAGPSTFNGSVNINSSLTLAPTVPGTVLAITSPNGTSVHSDFYITRGTSTPNTFATGPCIELEDIGATTATLLQQSGGQTELWQYNGGWNQVLYVGTGRAVVVNNGITVNGGAGVTLTLNPTQGQYGLQILGTGTGGFAGLYMIATGGTNGLAIFQNETTAIGYVDMLDNTNLIFRTNNNDRITIGASGAITIAAPSAGNTALQVIGDSLDNAPIVINSAGTSGSMVGIQVNNAGAGVLTGGMVQLGTNYFGTGAQTATFSASNKPGSGTTAPSEWIAVLLNNSKFYIPCWA